MESFSGGDMLQIIFFALVLGIAITMIPPEKGGPVIKFFDGINEVMIKLVHLIMRRHLMGSLL